VAAFINHSNEQKEAAGNKAMAHHLDHGALDADQVETDEP
jgi:hypothetical protein